MDRMRMIGARGTACKAPSPGDSPVDSPGVGLVRVADAALLAGILGAGLVLCGARAMERRAERASAGPAPDAEAFAHRVDLSTAGTAELMLLPGVGPRLAGRIAAEREARGPFASPEDVDRRVPGVGPARVRSWRGRVAMPAGSEGGTR
jgi:DNA uptake protein ComE-like DNA-binding protein